MALLRLVACGASEGRVVILHWYLPSRSSNANRSVGWPGVAERLMRRSVTPQLRGNSYLRPSMYTFYVLYSKKDNRLYLGSTKNFERRFNEHCSGLVVSTKNRRLLKLVYREEWPTKKEAMERERYFKGGGKAHNILKNLIRQQENKNTQGWQSGLCGGL